MNAMDLVLHGLAIKKHADASAIAPLIGLDTDATAALLERAAATGRASLTQGKYLLTPLARVALDCSYSKHCSAVRNDPSFVAAHEAFERINLDLKTLITDWQTIKVGSERIANDHRDTGYDERIIDRLGALHEHAEVILTALAAAVPRFAYYRRELGVALERAEDGATEWVSDARRDSYHTLWFELHEDLLRTIGRQRVE